MPTYPFKEIFERAGMKCQTIPIAPRTPKEQKRIDMITSAVKKFIAEAEQAHQASKNSTLHFGRSIFPYNVSHLMEKQQNIRY